MGKVISTTKTSTILVKVDGKSILDKVSSRFSCLTSSDSSEVVIDTSYFEDEEEFSAFCQILEISSDSDHADLFRNSGYIVLFAG
jgi:hypothetical protein